MESTETTSIAIREQAKARALKIIEENQDCTSYVRPEDLNTQSLFIPVVSVIKPTEEDFYPPIPKVGIMARPPLVNLIREKAGIEILRTDTQQVGRWVFKAHVYGQKRQPDGSMLPGDAAYTFDVETRAELDFLNQPDKYGSEVAKKRHMLEMAKTGEQRAVTGAQHALIHKLAHVARSFQSPKELMRGMIVCRIDRNVDGVLADPNMREAAISHMLGVRRELFGPDPSVRQAAALPAPEETAGEASVAAPEQPQQAAAEDEGQMEFPAPPPKAPAGGSTHRQDLEQRLVKFGQDERLPASAHEIIKAQLEDPFTKEEALQDTIVRCEQYLSKRGTKKGSAA
jgi:hypothetical protein